MAHNYDPTAVGQQVLLPEGECKFALLGVTRYRADSGNMVWKLNLETECDGVTVRRTHRITHLPKMPQITRGNIDNMLDAVGLNPCDDKIAAYFDKPEAEIDLAGAFPEKKYGLSAMIRRKVYEGREMDEIAFLIPKFYRAQWEAGRTGRTAQEKQPAASSASAVSTPPEALGVPEPDANGADIRPSDIPF